MFINDLPLAVIELKNPVDESANIWPAYQQLQTYKDEVSDLFTLNGAVFNAQNAHEGAIGV